MSRQRSCSLSKNELRSQIIGSVGDDIGGRAASASTSSVMFCRKIVMLFECKKYDECAVTIRRMSSSAIESCISELPFVDFIDAIPHSFIIIDAILSKMSPSGPHCPLAAQLRPRLLASYLVRWVSGMKNCGEKGESPKKPYECYRTLLYRILKVLLAICPDLKEELVSRKTMLETCAEGLGRHGLVSSALDRSRLTTVHDALKNACIHAIQCAKSMLHRLDDACPQHGARVRVPLQRDAAPVAFSHQRQIQVTAKEVENRLILNKTLLDAVEPSATSISDSMEEMLSLLRQRIRGDKEVVFCLAELRREIPSCSLSNGAAVLPQIQQLVEGYGIVVGMLEEIAPSLALDEREFRELELDAMLVTSGIKTKNVNQKTSSIDSSALSEEERLAELEKLGACSDAATFDGSHAATQVDSHLRQEVTRLKKELNLARKKLSSNQQTITQLQERERSLTERISIQAQARFVKSSTKFEDVSLGVNRPTQLIRRYGNLYAESRVDVLDALDELTELDEMDDLKTKLLFSIVILSFRSAEKSLKDLKHQMARLLDVSCDVSCDPSVSGSSTGNRTSDSFSQDVESSVLLYLRKTADKKHLSENTKEVCAQLWQTLYDYPSLKKCRGLLSFISEAVRLAWTLTIQNPRYVLEFDSVRFSGDCHTHFHTSNSDSNLILSYVWPGLKEGEDGPIVYRGVVVT